MMSNDEREIEGVPRYFFELDPLSCSLTYVYWQGSKIKYITTS